MCGSRCLRYGNAVAVCCDLTCVERCVHCEGSSGLCNVSTTAARAAYVVVCIVIVFPRGCQYAYIVDDSLILYKLSGSQQTTAAEWAPLDTSTTVPLLR